MIEQEPVEDANAVAAGQQLADEDVADVPGPPDDQHMTVLVLVHTLEPYERAASGCDGAVIGGRRLPGRA